MVRGRWPDEYKLPARDRKHLTAIAADGSWLQRVATRARALLALDRGERMVATVRWLGVRRTTLWYLWQHYTERGVEAIFGLERSGRPPTFSPSRTGRDRARRLHRASDLRTARAPVGLPHAATSDRRASHR